jgi:hypothetical protein
VPDIEQRAGNTRPNLFVPLSDRYRVDVSSSTYLFNIDSTMDVPLTNVYPMFNASLIGRALVTHDRRSATTTNRTTTNMNIGVSLSNNRRDSPDVAVTVCIERVSIGVSTQIRTDRPPLELDRSHTHTHTQTSDTSRVGRSRCLHTLAVVKAKRSRRESSRTSCRSSSRQRTADSFAGLVSHRLLCFRVSNVSRTICIDGVVFDDGRVDCFSC